MKNLTTALAFAVASIVSAQTSLVWVDSAKGGSPSVTAAFFAKDGWEVWAFGANNPKTLDLELGRLFPWGKKVLVGGYVAVWPDSNRTFGIPFVMVNDKVLGGHLCLKLGCYLPLNGGPTILFSDESSLLWEAKKGLSWGPILSYVQVDGGKPIARLGLSLRLTKGDETLELSCQPVYLSGDGETRFRIGITHRF
ncbi:hypothetical protein A3A71_00875 [Candidatus Berkelbacteria bacterium RIFCSPLOWO2_01_FULL_50_28]|uniref:Outer membrane protein beta-barrel domain-containing protein n=1 Tax=Candidatus Berkelbacteria bacterium RIFCSPLOWO2_01_FULL_50_28 TaxID=1797471 RepID=A0A1F5EBK0_9BACT|nr:MAG: hypothetical protein A2807_01445 [Candidatus Berkelbacteria bacterium RIFCSPHIGHO2_01_FULL_50_36]OGD62103.1 MAG: hypothetical protein A3F39_03100 [Candidatus Berkelbacteria bacterium RIFCSPHIGHO2_12_FULL_50_11]OGD64594.1 MAG: hypothetical protein A3A71_00875 [Candidatus Berkelbacteria bacterium RIFCSPLOWO2_01_FULL_50_28]